MREIGLKSLFYAFPTIFTKMLIFKKASWRMVKWIGRLLDVQEVHGSGPGSARVAREDPLCTTDIK